MFFSLLSLSHSIFSSFFIEEHKTKHTHTEKMLCLIIYCNLVMFRMCECASNVANGTLFIKLCVLSMWRYRHDIYILWYDENRAILQLSWAIYSKDSNTASVCVFFFGFLFFSFSFAHFICCVLNLSIVDINHHQKPKMNCSPRIYRVHFNGLLDVCLQYSRFSFFFPHIIHKSETQITFVWYSEDSSIPL